MTELFNYILIDMTSRISPYTLALCCAFISVSCTEEKISTYRVAVDEAEDTPAAPASELPAMTDGSLRWQALAGWQEETPGQFQKALYTLGPATKVSVSSLPGDAGGEAANVNRWRGQIGLEPVADVGGDLLSVEGGGISAKWFDLRGSSESILAAIISMGNDTWFFKMNSGDRCA
jgi:hypothetical protein